MPSTCGGLLLAGTIQKLDFSTASARGPFVACPRTLPHQAHVLQVPLSAIEFPGSIERTLSRQAGSGDFRAALSARSTLKFLLARSIGEGTQGSGRERPVGAFAREEALRKLEERAGADARKLFEAFLRKVDKLEAAGMIGGPEEAETVERIDPVR